MKRMTVTYLVVATILISVSNAYGGGYILLTAGWGMGGTSSAGSFGGEGGWQGSSMLLGLGMAVIATGGDWELISDNPLMSYEEKHIADAEFNGAVGVAVTKSWSLIGTVGRSYKNTKGRSTVQSGTPVEWQGDLHGGQYTYSGQMQHEQDHFIIGGGYHSSRGIVGRMGFYF